ncbi:MAG: glycosyltransferase [Candidatus Cloacimonetes bacterium]|nr:glycosyltransferase [Candidatus Cloacimonadota bacterium]
MNLAEGISIVIPTKNRIDCLVSLLESIDMAKGFVKEPIITETIVVSDGSDVHISDQLSKLLDQFQVNYQILKENKGPSYARNHGASLAQYNSLLFLDDDLTIQEDYFQVLQDLDLNEKIVGIEGVTKVEKNTSGLSTSASTDDFCGGFGSGNILYQKDVFLRLGGFDEHYFYSPLGIHFREDTDLGLHALALGQILLNKALVAFHPVHEGFDPWFIIKDARKYFFEAYFKRKNPMAKKYIGGWVQKGVLKTRQTRELVSLMICLSMLGLLFQEPIFGVIFLLGYLLLAVLILRKFSPKVQDLHYYLINIVLYPLVHQGFYIFGKVYFLNKRDRKREAF